MPDCDADLSLEGVSVAYGRQSVLRDVTFRVQPGSTYALLGRNGAGKSSLIRSLLGYRPHSTGEIRLLGKDPWKARKSLLKEIGVVPETPDAPPRMNIRQLLRFCERLYPRWSQVETKARLGTSRELGSLAPISRPQEPPGTPSTALFTDHSDSLWTLEADGSFRQLTEGRVLTRTWPGPGIPRKLL